MSEVKKIVNFNDEEFKIIKDDVSSIYQNVLNTSFKRFFISNKYKWLSYIILIVGIILFITGITCTMIFKEEPSKTIYFGLIFSGFAIIIIAIISFSIGQVFNNKIKNCGFSSIMVLIVLATKVSFDVSNNFTIIPQKFLVFGSSMNHRVWTEKVLVGNVNNQDFNCGTMIEKIVRVQKTGKSTTIRTTYNRYLYFTCHINPQDFVTTIKPETLGSRIMGSNRGDQLESSEFEKLFALDYSDPIKLRKLLVPKIMSNMIDLATMQKPLPNIFVNETQVTLMYPYMNISSPNSSNANLLNLIIKNSSEEELLNDVLAMLDFTLNIVMYSYAWISSLELNSKLVSKN
ncbi:hypothetical protein [Spiroplasma sp. AdecLV25b]|uniref:hypothetical protein n=1 Tax=Spiroplasma sp. AdecLV25b TaxID=3027162 RepID=UPI0027E12358|nr:hypothetical protein [Spiroplasma sp. AdecLV25b]